jgi:hypothetical protein
MIKNKLAEEMNTYVKMVSDNLIKERHYQSIHDILQAHPKEVNAFKSDPHNFPIQKHKEFYKDLWDMYSNSGEMPHEVVKASSERYKAQWIMDKLHDEISGQEPDEFNPHDDLGHDDSFDMDLEYDDDNDWGGFDNFESKLMKEDDAKSILAKHPEDVKKANQTGEIEYNSPLWTELFYYYQDEMPYGTQKARDGDPGEYIHDKLADLGIHFDPDLQTEAEGDVYSTETPHGDDLKDSTMHGLLDQIEDYYHKETGDNDLDVQISDDHVYIGDAKFEIYKNGEDLGYDLGDELEREDISTGRGPYQHKLQGDDLERSKTMTPDEIKALVGVESVKEEQLNEWVWLLPALATAVRVGGPALIKILKHGKNVSTKVAPVAGKTATAIVKNPGTSLTWLTGGYLFKSMYDVVEKIKDIAGDLLDNESVNTFAKIVWKYKLPAAAVVAILYGGKKLKDYIAGEEEQQGNTTINNYYNGEKPEQQMASKNIDRLKHLSGI